jgi:hypothetical protein
MSESVRQIDYFYAEVDDKPGEGRKLLEFLSAYSVNLIAFTAFPIGDGKSQLDFFPDNAEILQKAASEANIPLVGPKKAFLIQGDERVGALAEHHLRLSDAGVNTYAANGVTGGSGRYGYIIWVRPEDFNKAANALGA